MSEEPEGRDAPPLNLPVKEWRTLTPHEFGLLSEQLVDDLRIAAFDAALAEEGDDATASDKRENEARTTLLAFLDAVRGSSQAGSAPVGPWRVIQNAGAQPQPRFVEYWEGPLPEQYGAQWVPNGFPTAEEAQAVCDALNAHSQRIQEEK